jgi:hypothetical protein
MAGFVIVRLSQARALRRYMPYKGVPPFPAQALYRQRRCTTPSPFFKKMLFYSGTLNQKYVSCHIYRRGGKGWQK